MPAKINAPHSQLSAKQKGAVAEIAHDIAVLARSGGALRIASVEADDGGIDRLIYAPDATDRALFVNPKGAHTLQRGRVLEFRVPLWKIPGDGKGYFAVLCPLADMSPWIGGEVWLIPGNDLLAGGDRTKQKVIRVPVEPDPDYPWDRFRRPIESLASTYADALGAPLYEPRDYHEPVISETAQAWILEAALFCHLTMASGGLLHGWRPVVDDEGLDLAFKFAGVPVALGLQPKGALQRDADGLIQVHVPAATFHADPHNFLVILEFDPQRLTLGEFRWFIPTEQIAARVAKSDGTFVFRVSPDPRSTKDNFLPWRYPAEEFPAVVATALAVLAREGPRAKLPSRQEDVRKAQHRLMRGATQASTGNVLRSIQALRLVSCGFK